MSTLRFSLAIAFVLAIGAPLRTAHGQIASGLDNGRHPFLFCGRRPNDNQRKQALKEHRTRSTQVTSLRFEGIAGSLHCMIEASDPQVEDLTAGSGARR